MEKEDGRAAYHARRGPEGLERFKEKYPCPADCAPLEYSRSENSGKPVLIAECIYCHRARKLTAQDIKNGALCQCQKAKKARVTCFERYGVDNPLKNEEIKKRARDANMNKYGVEYACQSESVKDKIVATNIEKYGVVNAAMSEEVKAKIVETNLKRYGVPYAIMSDSVRDKATKTNMERYGAPMYLRSDAAQAQLKERCLEKYGVEYYIQSQDFKDKTRATSLDRYGVDFATQSEDVKSRSLITRHKNLGLTHGQSKQEAELAGFVESLGLSQRKYSSRAREIDVFIESKMIGIEFNGTYWHSEAQNKGPSYHIDKTNMALKEGIELIHIWSHVWETRRLQVEAFLRAKLGMCSNIIGARKCTVVEIPFCAAIKFVDDYHILGSCPSSVLSLGAFIDGELSAVSTFAVDVVSGYTELSRICTKPNTIISGFMGKSVTCAFNRFGPIVSYADRCLTNGKSYLSSGFRLIEEIEPDYKYMRGGGHGIISREEFSTIENLPEDQKVRFNNLHRFWDCGKLKFMFAEK
jgi:hypothetical protein